MKMIPLPEIKTPAILKLGGSFVVCTGSIKPAKSEDTRDVDVSHAGVVGKIAQGTSFETKFTPTRFSNIDVLLAPLSLTKGSSLFEKAVEAELIFRVGTKWKSWKFSPRTAITGMGGITFGMKNAPFGEFTLTTYQDPSDSTAPLYEEKDLETAPTLPTLSNSDIFALSCLAVYGEGESAVAFDTSGASIEISLTTSDAEVDRRISVYDKILDDITVTAKMKPRNITFDDWSEKVSKIGSAVALGTFTGVGTSPNLLLRDEKAGGYSFKLRSAEPTNPSATFGAKEALMDEITFTANGDELGENKLTYETTSAAFEFDPEEEEEPAAEQTQASEQSDAEGETQE